MKQVCGWLPYGSTDESVVFARPLTRRLTTADVAGAWANVNVGSVALTFDSVDNNLHGHWPTHDTVMGMKAVSDVDGITEVSYQFNTALQAIIDASHEFQITIEAQKEWFDVFDATYNPGAWAPPLDFQSLLSMLPTTGGTITGHPSKATSGVHSWAVGSNSTATFDYRNFERNGINGGAARIISDLLPGEFATLQMAGMGQIGILAINGAVIGYCDRDRFAVYLNFMNNFYIGSDRGIANRAVTAHWFRNLQIANRAPVFSMAEPIGRLCVLSDSIVSNSVVADIGQGGIHSPGAQIQGAFNKIGKRCDLVISNNGGYRAHDDGPGGADSLADVYQNALVNDPYHGFLQAGTNDAGAQISAVDFEAAYKDRINELMGEGGNPATTLQRLTCITPPSRIPGGQVGGVSQEAEEAFIELYVPIILSMPDWWDATYPARAGQLDTIDMNTILGGRNPIAGNLFKGQVTGVSDIHYGPYAYDILSKEMIKKIFNRN